MTKHTLGPWRFDVSDKIERLHCIWGDHDGMLLVARTCFAPNSEPNARLIAAAPDLLDFAKRMHSETCCICKLGSLRKAMGSADEMFCTYCESGKWIAKAEGRS